MPRRTIIRGILFAAIASYIGTSDVHSKSADIKNIINACWDHDRFSEKNVNGTMTKTLIGSHLICFQRRGWATGVTFDAGDGWDWRIRYKIINRVIFFDDKPYGKILDVDQSQMIVEVRGEQRSYRYVCRSKTEDIQCERLRYRR